MGRMILITTLLLMFVFPTVYAQKQVVTVPTKAEMQQYQQQQIQQEKAGAWVGDWWENVVEVQIKANLDKEAKDTCTQKLERYNKKVQKKPDSEYYKMKLKKWTKRCTAPTK